MEVMMLNSGSFGGELIVMIAPPSQLILDIKNSGMTIRGEDNPFFQLIDIRNCKDNRLRQKLIDLVEEDLDYNILIEV